MAVGSSANWRAWAGAGGLALAAGCAGTDDAGPSPLEPLHRETGVLAATEELRAAAANARDPGDDTARLRPRDMLTDTLDDGSLVAGLSHGEAFVRAIAARGLALHTNDRADGVLLARASQETEAEVLVEIAFALGQRATPTARPRLTELL
ncbi:MAG: hypothetical protein ACYTCU_10235, partial [Planctomycetota bacterium]